MPTSTRDEVGSITPSALYVKGSRSQPQDDTLDPFATPLRVRTMPKCDFLRFLFRGFRGFGLRFAKSAVKVAIGRKPHFYPQDLFFLAYLRHLLGLSQMCISSKVVDYSSEGGGSHAILTMTVIDFARALRLDYVHTPFIEIHHADRPPEAWLAAWEGLFNFGAGEARAEGTDRDVFSITPINFDPIRSLFGDLRPYN